MGKAKQIGVFGRRNGGKSSLINTLSGQEVAIVSDQPGTTTDPVKKRMELTDIGPVVFIDTAGIDDVGSIGEKRVAKSREVVEQIDIALMLYTNNRFGKEEEEWMELFERVGVPLLLIHNQSDIVPLNREEGAKLEERYETKVIEFSCSLLDEESEKSAVEALLKEIGELLKESGEGVERGLFDDLVKRGDKVLLITPIGEETPKGRLILPQVNAIRELLDRGALVSVAQPEALEEMGEKVLRDVDLVVTDSQVFDKVNPFVPRTIPLTGFSLILARKKGNFEHYLAGTPLIDKLKEGEKVLVLESCSHQISCEDIGRVKIPNMIESRLGVKLSWRVIAGLDPLPKDIKSYSLVIQCGGCMVTDQQLARRIRYVLHNGVPVTNYGMTLAWCMGIYERAAQPFLEIERSKDKSD